MALDNMTPKAASWRKSKTLLWFTATLGLFTENFLYGFVVPILPYMIETRLHQPPSTTQTFTTSLLVILGLISVPSAPIIAHFADRAATRKYPLLLSLTGCTLGTILVASTPSVWAIYVGRILQGISGTGAWIVGFAMLTDVSQRKDVGKALGFAGSFITAGVLLGPAVAGAMLQWLGYWGAWAVPLVLLALDFAARIAMVEERRAGQVKEDGPAEEDEPLLNGDGGVEAENADGKPRKGGTAWGFYSIMLSKGKTWAALFNVTAFAMMVSGFDATLPLHLRNTFGWGSAPIGSIFLGFQIPTTCLGPFVGWLRDRVGLRWPTTIGWILLAPLLWFSGVPGDDDFLGIGNGRTGEGAFVSCIIAIGIVTSFVRGAGTFQLTTMLNQMKEEDPMVFGAGGGSSRMFSLTEMSFNIGLIAGPLVCGGLADTIGFYGSSCALAAAAVIVAITSFAFFTHGPPMRKPASEE